MPTQKTVLVAGDMIIDSHIYEGSRHHFGDSSQLGVQVIPEVGGAALIDNLLANLSKNGSGPPAFSSQLAKEIPKESDWDKLNRSLYAYAFWRSFPQDGSRHGSSFWRVSEAMGFGAIRSPMDCDTLPNANIPDDTHIVVLSDGGMGFRESDSCWKHLPFESAEWIVLKSTAPLCEGTLWGQLTTSHADKLVLVVSASDLRKSTARISKGLSWDTTLRHLINELAPDGALHELALCRHLVVAFGSEAALWIDFGQTAETPHGVKASLMFDCLAIEDDHTVSIKGTAFGFLSCLTASVIRQLCSEEPDFELGCEGGLSAMQNLRREGHGPANEEASGFPAGRLADVIRQPDAQYSRARFRIPPDGLPGDWSILGESLRPAPKADPIRHSANLAYKLAELVAERGPIALDNLPGLKVGHLRSVDRCEVEALRSLMNLMRRYQHTNPGRKPLSIGVFGPPGSGKSFAVKQLAHEICGAQGWLEFNLSQFASTDDLIGAFHQIRDHVLRGILPVAFFDEFDAQSYRWLQYLLAPMQDGAFQAGQITHPIGKCIFVFAGGTSWTFETFGPPDGADQSDFQSAKGPDFKSRLDGFLDVLGPNQRRVLEPDPTHPQTYRIQGADASDYCFPIRRALMIRGELGCAPTDKLEIDEGILHALLHAEAYKHGSRSLAKILQPFKSAGCGPLYKSSLPPKSQIGMHTNADKFLDDCNEAPRSMFRLSMTSGSQPLGPHEPLGEHEVEILAPAIHETYREQGRSAGWLTSENDVDFEALDELAQNSNRAAARRMLRNLSLIDLKIEPGENTDEEREWLGAQIEYHLEVLAEAEHDGWMQWHFEHGWRYAPIPRKDSERKLHPSLLPYQRLSATERDKDRNTIREYTNFARQARCRVVPA